MLNEWKPTIGSVLPHADGRLRILRLQPGHVCVDLGCGEGRHSLTAYLQEDVTVIGLDLSHQDLKTAQSRIADMASYNPKGSVDFAQANGLSLPLADHSVDRLICSEVLEHIPTTLGF